MKQKYILGSINICILITSLIFLIICISNIELLSKNELIILIASSLIGILFSIKAYLSKKITIYNLGIIITLIFNITTIYKIYEINADYSCIENIISQKYQYNEYYVYVKKNKKYNSLDKIKNKKVGILEKNEENIKDFIQNKGKFNYITYKNSNEMIEAFENNEIQAIIISKKTLKELEKEEKIANYHKIYSSKIKEDI